MATKIIKAWVDGAIQDVEVEDVTSPEQMPSPEERIDVLEDKHEVVFTDGNLLVGNGSTELEEMTPEEVLSHINGASVMTLTTEEYEALEENNANTLYLLTDDEDTSVLYTEQTLTDEQKAQVRENIGAASTADIPAIDPTLTIEGSAADAKAVGDALLSHKHATSDITSGVLGVEFGGTGYSSITDTTYTTARYRASSLHSAETTPTDNGVICWTYE